MVVSTVRVKPIWKHSAPPPPFVGIRRQQNKSLAYDASHMHLLTNHFSRRLQLKRHLICGGFSYLYYKKTLYLKPTKTRWRLNYLYTRSNIPYIGGIFSVDIMFVFSIHPQNILHELLNLSQIIVLYLLFSVLWFDDLTESIGPFDKKNTLELAKNAITKVILKMQPTWKNIDFFWTQRKKSLFCLGTFRGSITFR